MKMRKFESSIWISAPVETMFAFFSNAENLDKITPPWLHFKILTALPVEMKEGTLLDYRLKLHGIPVRWQTQITNWNPPFQFVDIQLHGPYRKWIHTHTFTSQNNGMLVGDSVNYEVPGFFLEPLIHKYFVQPDIAKIFEYRRNQLLKIFS